MIRKHCSGRLVLIFLVGVCFITASFGEVAAEVQYKKCFAKGDQSKAYYLAGTPEMSPVPKDGFALVIVIPDTEDLSNCESFVKQLCKQSLSNKYLVAQLAPAELTEKKTPVWPTEQLVRDIVQEVGAKYSLDTNLIFTLSWGSGGPAAYAVSLQESKIVTGSYIAMSPFEPETLPPLSSAKGHAYAIECSPVSEVCPISVAQKAYKSLRANGAVVKVVQNKDDKEWVVNSFPRIRYGIKWLEANHGKAVVIKAVEKSKEVEKSETAATVKKEEDAGNFDTKSVESNLLVEPLVGVGPIKFGISKADVIKHLGKPESENRSKSGDTLYYVQSNGLMVTVHPRNGVAGIDCFGYPGGKHIAYTTTKGIKMGATRAEIEAVYGKAEQADKVSEDSTQLGYSKLRTGFSLKADKLVQIILFPPK